jgi:sulfur transfer protein SufE
MSGTDLSNRLDAIVEEFRDAPDDLRIELLLEYAESLPALPDPPRQLGHGAGRGVPDAVLPAR